MKKYLMSGIAAIAIAAAFTSCSKSTDLYEGPKQPEQPTPVEEPKTKQELYQEVFENEFGKIDPNQTWGFVDQTVKQTASTRGHNVNRNEWGTGNGNGGHVAVPKNITDYEYSKVTAEFAKKREGVTNTININWTDFYVTQVHMGTTTYNDGNGNPIDKGGVGSAHMNQLMVKKLDQNDAIGGEIAWEHVNDFNNGANTTVQERSDLPENIIGHTFMENSGTFDFAYHNTVDSKYHNEYIIIPGADIDPLLAGYWYVGFDFYATHPTGQEANKNMDVERDWVFDDWIVRIAPGEFVGSQRVFVEDLITSDLNTVDPSDWDFNDAVFDAYIYNNPYWDGGAHNYAVITLRAAGGTLPLTISDRDVHDLFGVSQDQMVNTGSGPEVAPVMFRLSANEVKSGNATDIPVIVTTKEGEKITLTAKVGDATQKIAAPIANHVKWLKERIHIKNGYPTFMDYVGDATKIWYVPANDGSLFQKWY